MGSVAAQRPDQKSHRQSVPRPALVRVGALLLAVLVVAGCAGTRRVSSYQYDWNIFFESVFRPSPMIVNGIWLTVSIAIVAQIIGVVLGVFAALGRMAKSLPFKLVANFYIWLFRGTPLLVQISFIYFGLGVTKLYAWPTLDILGVSIPGAIQAGIFALGVNEGAYMAEIVRAGIISIDLGQMEAAKSLGMTYALGMRRIVLPQAARVIVPPLGNEFNNMLKNTSLLVAIAVTELYVTFSYLNGSGPTSFHPFELFLAAAVWYLVLTTIWTVIQAWIESKLGKGTGRQEQIGLWDRLTGFRLGASSAGLGQAH
jgi:polar amino acid transport system permease protein